MPTFLDRVKFNVSGTPGTGNVTIGSAVSTFQTPSAAGGVTGDILPITFVDGTAWEESYCYFDSAAGTLARTLLKSSTGSLLSLTSAAVGAVTNFARDAIGKGDGLVYIGQQVLGATAASASFSNIPQDYEDLIVVASGRLTGSSVDVLAQINGDTGANYRSETINAFSTSVAGSQNAAATSMRVGVFPGTSGGAPTGYVGSFQAVIHNYARTSLHKGILAEWQCSTGTGGFTQGRGIEAHMWANTAAVTSLSVFPTSGSFEAGTVITLYARAKSNGAGSNDPTLFLIHDQILASDSATYDVSNIPQTYEDLVIMVEARQNGSNAAVEWYIRPNNDTGSNYTSYVENRFGTGTATDKARFGCSEAGSATAGVYGPSEGVLFGYSKTNRYKEWLSQGFYPSGSFIDKNAGVWKSNSAVTSLRFFPNANSFVAGTRIRVYGRKPLLAPQANIANGNIRDALGAAWAKEMVVNGAAITAGVTRSVVATSGPFVAMKLVANTNVASGSKVIGSAKYTVPAGCKAFVMYAEFEDNERSNTGFYRARCYNSTQSRTAADAASGQVPSTSPGTTNWSNSYTGLLADPSGGGSGSVNAYYPTAGSAGDVLQMEAWTSGDGNYRIQHFTAYLVIVDAVTGDPRIA